MLRIGSIVLRVDDLARQVAFWCAALDYVPREEASDDFVLLRPHDGDGPSLSLDLHRAGAGLLRGFTSTSIPRNRLPRSSACSASAPRRCTGRNVHPTRTT